MPIIPTSATTALRSRFLCGILGGSRVSRNTIFATTVGTIARRDLRERDLRAGLAVAAVVGLDAHRHQEGQHFACAAPEPARRLRPCLLTLDVDVHLFGFYLELGVEVTGQARPLVTTFHKREDGLRDRRAVERALILYLDHFAPVGQARPTVQPQGLFCS